MPQAVIINQFSQAEISNVSQIKNVHVQIYEACQKDVFQPGHWYKLISVGKGLRINGIKSQENLSLGVCDQLRLKQPAQLRLKISDIESRGIIISKAANNKGADQTMQMRRLICAFVVRIWHKTCFLMTWLNEVFLSVCMQTSIVKSSFEHNITKVLHVSQI